MAAASCSGCGTTASDLVQARARIAQLEAQIRQLTTEQASPTARLTSFLYSRGKPPPTPPPSSDSELREALSREQMLRKEAEGRLTATSQEVEELSASLFEQANSMVADERRARAKLEARVDELEKRDREKRRRLERLEGALVRIEKVRTLLGED